MTLFVRLFSTTDFVNLFTKKQRKKHFFCDVFQGLFAGFSIDFGAQNVDPITLTHYTGACAAHSH